MPAKSPEIHRNSKDRLLELGQQIRRRRKLLRISAAVTAEAAGMSRITLNRLERGEASVSIGSYINALTALGLSLQIVDLNKQKTSTMKLPTKIKIAEYKQLKNLAWQVKDSQELTPEEALNLYERNWRHVDQNKIEPNEKKLINALLAAFGRERLLV